MNNTYLIHQVGCSNAINIWENNVSTRSEKLSFIEAIKSGETDAILYFIYINDDMLKKVYLQYNESDYYDEYLQCVFELMLTSNAIKTFDEELVTSSEDVLTAFTYRAQGVFLSESKRFYLDDKHGLLSGYGAGGWGKSTPKLDNYDDLNDSYQDDFEDIINDEIVYNSQALKAWKKFCLEPELYNGKTPKPYRVFIDFLRGVEVTGAECVRKYDCSKGTIANRLDTAKKLFMKHFTNNTKGVNRKAFQFLLDKYGVEYLIRCFN